MLIAIKNTEIEKKEDHQLQNYRANSSLPGSTRSESFPLNFRNSGGGLVSGGTWYDKNLRVG